MFQEIITFIVLAITAWIFFLKIRIFFKDAESSKSGKCAGCSGVCEIKEYKKFYQPKILKPEHYKLKL